MAGTMQVPEWNSRDLSTAKEQKQTQADPKANGDNAKPETKLNFEITTSKTLFLYRLGIGELQFNPKNLQLGESISIGTNVENNIYGKTNPFVSYINTNREFSLSFLMPAEGAGFRLVAEQNSPFNTYAEPNGSGLTPFMNVFKSFLYANYNTVTDSANENIVARTIKSPPVFKLMMKSIISNGTFPQSQQIGEEIVSKYHGLLGFIKDFKLDPLYGIGYVPFSATQKMITGENSSQYFDVGGNFKEVKVSFTFIPIFEEPLGWDTENNNFSGVKELGGLGGANIVSKILKRG